MKHLRKYLLRTIAWEHILPFLFLNGYLLYSLPYLISKGFERGYSLLVISIGAILAIILLNLCFLILHFIIWAYIRAIEVTPKAMVQAEFNRPAIVLEIPISRNIQISEKSPSFAGPNKQEKRQKISFYPPLKLSPLSNLPYDLFLLTSILRP